MSESLEIHRAKVILDRAETRRALLSRATWDLSEALIKYKEAPSPATFEAVNTAVAGVEALK